MPTVLEVAGVPIPDSVTGTSLLQAVGGGPWREYLHGEHSPCYSLEEAMHYLTDGRSKCVWFPATGEEQFFDLVQDRGECVDLARDPTSGERGAKWRQRLIALLAERGDGLSDGERLIGRSEWWSGVVE